MASRCVARVASLLVLAGACAGETGAPATRIVTRLEARSTLPLSGVAGSTVSTAVAVAASDADGEPVPGASVLFAVTAGNGRVSPASGSTDANGVAQAVLTLGTIAGANEVTASVRGVLSTIRFAIQGTAGAPHFVTVAPRPVRFPVGTDSLRVTTSTFDKFGNRTSQAAALTVRDPSLLIVDDAGFAHVQRRGGSTYVVATTGGHADSTLAIVLAPGDSPCTAIAVGRTLSLGEVAPDVASSGTCVRGGDLDEEFVLIPYFGSNVPGSSIQLQVQASGVGVAGPAADIGLARVAAAAPPIADAQWLLDKRLRELESRELPPRAAAARDWYRGRPRASAPMRPPGPAAAPRFAGVPANAAVGDLLSLNVNASEYCSNPIVRTARVAAVSARAIVVADTNNPRGGFTDDEYRSFAITFDTLVSVVDVEAFGEPSDIDGNGRVVIFFTRAVNELSPRGGSSVVLGFYFSRDLLPSSGSQDNCKGSNVAELFYMLVPDVDGVASDPRSKAFVASSTNGTIAHEYQHLINASRRLYVNHAAEVNEESWLNEGLSHIAEELAFYRASGRAPRQDLGASILEGASTAEAFRQYQNNNLRRYATYLRATLTQAPIGIAGDDDLETRGAAWSFLRYVADRIAPSDATFWYRLVNSQTTGLANLTTVLARDPAPVLRDWAASVYLDESSAAIDPQFTQPSWNFRSLFPASGTSFPLFDATVDRRLNDGVTMGLSMRGGGAAFLRFVVRAGQEALLTVSSGGQPAPVSIRLSVARIR